MLNDNVGEKEQIILSYFATADKGLIDAMKINPIKTFVILDDYPIAFHSIRIREICQNKDILKVTATKAEQRKEKAKTTDYAEIKKQLQKEVQSK